jgi:hypothetical protein
MGPIGKLVRAGRRVVAARQGTSSLVMVVVVAVVVAIRGCLTVPVIRW